MHLVHSYLRLDDHSIIRDVTIRLVSDTLQKSMNSV